jgi:Flp pilus assembly protein TadG
VTLRSKLARMKKMRREDGASIVELAFIMAILGPLLLLGTTELSIYVYASVELTDATHAAASFASQYYFENSNSTLPTQTQVTAAATNDAPELVSMLKSGSSFTATMATGCGTGNPTTGNTVPTCTGGALPYIQVTGQATVSPVANFLSRHSITMTSQARINLVK